MLWHQDLPRLTHSVDTVVAHAVLSYTIILGVLDKLEWEFLEEGPAGVMAWLAEARGLLRETTTAG